jgi:hypothetical protein
MRKGDMNIRLAGKCHILKVKGHGGVCNLKVSRMFSDGAAMQSEDHRM